MTNYAIRKTLALGALTGMRSMSGPAALAFEHDGLLKGVTGLLAAGEMIADKTSAIGDRIDAAPLAGRAVMGAIVGAVVAYEDRGNALARNIAFGCVLGAATAVVAAHVAFHARKSLAGSSALGGFVEDAIVVGLSSAAVRAR